MFEAVFPATFFSLFATASSYWIVGTKGVPYRGFNGAPLREYHSYLEKVDRLARVVRVYLAATNMFIDSIACHNEWISMIQRSIFGSDGSHLVRWKTGSGGACELLAHLEEKASQIYHCEGR